MLLTHFTSFCKSRKKGSGLLDFCFSLVTKQSALFVCLFMLFVGDQWLYFFCCYQFFFLLGVREGTYLFVCKGSNTSGSEESAKRELPEWVCVPDLPSSLSPP